MTESIYRGISMFQKTLHVALFSFLLLGLTACGDSSSKRGRYNVAVYDTDLNVSDLSRDWTVRCRNSNQCPNTVAQVLMATGRSAGVCTATLIANDTAITNSHCFDFDTGNSPDFVCRTGTVLIFASNSPSGREVVECERVIKKSRIGADGTGNFRNPDYMILKLKRSLNRGYEVIDPQGMEDGLRLTVKKVNPVRRSYGELVVESCETLHGTLLMPGANHPNSPVHTMGRCEVISGNSGSSLFDRNGKIRGLIFAGLTEDSYTKLERTTPKPIIDQMKAVRPSLATNAACIEYSERRFVPNECLKGLTEAEQEVDLKTTEGYTRIQEQISRFPVNPQFDFTLKEGKINSDQTLDLTYRPSCHKLELASLPAVSSIPIQVYSWKASLGVDARLRPTINPGQAQPRSCVFNLYNYGRNSVEMTTTDDRCLLSTERYSYRETLNKCLNLPGGLARN
jgi:hypothetical protein